MWILYLSTVSYGGFAKTLLRRHENGIATLFVLVDLSLSPSLLYFIIGLFHVKHRVLCTFTTLFAVFVCVGQTEFISFDVK